MMNDNGAAGPEADETASDAREKKSVEGAVAMNGQQNLNAGAAVAVSEPSAAAAGQRQLETAEPQEAAEVPIGQISYGHDGESINDSPSLDYSEYDSDLKAAGSQLVGESYASVLVSSVGSSGVDGDAEGDASQEQELVNGESEKQKVNDTEKGAPLSPSSLLRTHSMPETLAKIDSTEVAVPDASLLRLQSASMNISPTKLDSQQQPKQQDQQQEIEPHSHSSEDDDNSVNLPQTLQQSTIVEKSPAERYIRFKEKLGSGAYKDVYRAYDTIEGIEVAWNVVKLYGVPKAERVRIVNEVRLLERLHHPNIISFHGSWVNRETERVIFVTEILSSGTLKSFVSKVQLIRWKIFKRWAIQILKGLEYLHSQDPPIIHRDLKCDNIFINGTSGDLRIGDFGLSTAISKKNQPLSVLGTPEFMAPELYDENYNEKVDIYAFGMLLLEIATNQVPYHECSNPAQIYKKVISGIAPASLRRVKSENARNFILLCLGIGQDANSRPSATELLNHPFLAKHPNDESTIEVEPAIEDMVIDEMAPLEARPGSLRNGKGVSLTISDTASEFSMDKVIEQPNSKYSQSIDGHELPSKGASLNLPAEHDVARDESTVSSKLSEHAGGDDDQFGEMPENEANMKPVKVMMGRGTALTDVDSEPPTQQMEEASLSQIPPCPPTSNLTPTPAQVQVTKNHMTRSISEADNSSMGSVPQYKVSSVQNPVNPSSNDGAINLALTLPDENQTTVEFLFDLVNDDPVQVAKEMVMELDEVPNDAVLDISEAISGVARQARQQNFLHQQQHFRMPSQGIPPQQQLMNRAGYHGMGYQTPGGPIIQQQLGVASDMSSSLQHHQHQQTPHLQYQTPGVPGGDSILPVHQQQQPLQPAPMSYQATPGATTSQQHLGDQQHGLSFQTPSGTPIIHQNAVNNQPQQQQSTIFQSQTPSGLQQHAEAHSHVSVPHHLRIGSDLTAQHPWQHNSAPPPPPMPLTSTQPLPPRPASTPQLTQQYPPQQGGHLQSNINTDDMITKQQSPQVMQQPMTTSIAQVTSSSHDTATVQSNESGFQSAPTPIPSTQQKESSQLIAHPPHMVVVPESSVLEDEAEDENEVDVEELKKLEEEFEKRLQRAKKSYGTRMDNLQRSKVEAEAMHQMTLEKHEKERIEFEKRVRLAEEEQNRRLNQIEKEFKEKKDKFRQQRGHPNGEKPPLHGGGHKRSSSHFEPSSLQCPTPAADLRRNVSMHHHSHATHHKRDHSTQSSISFSASDISEDHLHIDLSPKAPMSGGFYVEDMNPPPNSHPVRHVESSPSLRDKDQNDSTSSQA